MIRTLSTLGLLVLCLQLVACGNESEPAAPVMGEARGDLPGVEETQAIAKEAYLYGSRWS
jgi:hypothetical protein